MEWSKTELWKHRWLWAGLALVFTFSQFPEAVEQYYSTGFYPYLGKFLRLLLGWCPFSIGDAIYVFAIGYGIVIIFKFLYIGFRYKKWPAFGKVLLKLTVYLAWVYIVFKISWGFNYDRPEIGQSLKITPSAYTLPELKSLNNQLIQRLNDARAQIPGDSLPAISWKEQKELAYDGYQQLAAKNRAFTYSFPSLKKCSWNFLGEWIGFTGYFNPFSGEAQVKADLPSILLPYTTCHEIGHQIGFARESEASFAGLLAASASKDVRLKYSLYLDIYSLIQQELWRQYAATGDSTGLRQQFDSNRQRLDTLVKLDRKAIRRYFQQRTHQITPAFTQVYTQYLKANGQASGMLSYSEVLGWLLAYQKKYGENSW
jgi:hypothetical protein